MNTTRTIEQILDIKLRAAGVRVQERAAALAADPQNEDEQRAARLADEALEKTRREIEQLKGLPEGVEPEQYEPASTWALRRYAAILREENPDLTMDEAMLQAHRDENEWFESWYARFADNSDLDEE
jgi:hypothetical protein